MEKDLFKVHLLSLAGLLSFVLTFASCANEDAVQKKADVDNDNDKNLTTFSTGIEPESRTSMDYNSGAFYWEAGDYIFVKDDNDEWQQSSNTPTTKTTNFKFYVPGDFKNRNTYEVYYPGKYAYYDQVTILTAQTQTEPNSTIHFGESGDCGTATATKYVSATGHIDFRFSIDHQAAYLVFQPYTNNKGLQQCYLTKIEVSSDNDIASTYTLDPVNGLTGTGTGKKITLTTKGSGTYTNGFPLNTNSANVTTNGAYMIIKPGQHTLTVRYWVKDIITQVEGAITKTLSSFNYIKNNYYDMTAELDVKNYKVNDYYQWDAQKPYWYGYEWDKGGSQPTLNFHLQGSTTSNDYAKNASDPRYYNNSFPGYKVINNATTPHFKKMPTSNEMVWYAAKGDAHWDDDKLWTCMNHLYKGGIWLKKKAFISGFNKDKDPNEKDVREDPTGNFYYTISKKTAPSASEINQYFYLPALGQYVEGRQYTVGASGYYWSSNGMSWGDDLAQYLVFDKWSIQMNFGYRSSGIVAQPFTDFGEDE